MQVQHRHEIVIYSGYTEHMDMNRSDEKEQRLEHLAPPQNTTSYVLNGAGNGMTIGAIPFAALELYHNLVLKKEPPKAAIVATIFTTVAGAAIGGYFGMTEARQINRYRKAVREEIIDLREQIDEKSAELDRWIDKAKTKSTQEKKDISR